MITCLESNHTCVVQTFLLHKLYWLKQCGYVTRTYALSEAMLHNIYYIYILPAPLELHCPPKKTTRILKLKARHTFIGTKYIGKIEQKQCNRKGEKKCNIKTFTWSNRVNSAFWYLYGYIFPTAALIEVVSLSAVLIHLALTYVLLWNSAHVLSPKMW